MHLLKLLSIFLFVLSCQISIAQELTGTVFEQKSEGQKTPLPGVNIFWYEAPIGTVTDVEGNFSIERVPHADTLIISYIGFENDTLKITNQKNLVITLNSSVELKTIEVEATSTGSKIDYQNPIKTQIIDENEFLKAACCNLSESFETNPSVDVNFTDAVTGTKQIQMLGLAGPYAQITQENMPYARGLASMFGLTFIPATWVESLQLNKGTGSVVNGYESIAGQINIELQKPENSDLLYLNGYGNAMGRYEFNANSAFSLNEKWHTGILAHTELNNQKNDVNNDGFLDAPLRRDFIAMNRWRYQDIESGLRSQFGAKIVMRENTGGQTSQPAFSPQPEQGIWGMNMQNNRLEAFAKIGKVYNDKPWKSFGWQNSYSYHEQNAFMGLNAYEAEQQTFYSNFIYQSIIGNTNHKIKAGASFLYDELDEDLSLNRGTLDTSFNRSEIVPGAYFEHTWSSVPGLSVVSGIRADYHNIFGFFITPRLHARYEIQEGSVARLAVGRGLRTSNIFADNISILATSREVIINGDKSNNPYGLNQEDAWNTGLSFTQYFSLAQQDGTLNLDFFYTEFVNQIVVDYDENPQKVEFSNLDGRSRSLSFQVQIDYELFENFDIRTAYRWFDVKAPFGGEFQQRPLVSEHRAFINLAYETHKQWKFDLTWNWQGKRRLPSTESNPEEYQLSDYSPSYSLVNAQISKRWTDKFEIYSGVENLFDFRQENPILASDQPFSEYFDSSIIWGPIFGRNIYAGVRFWIK